MSFLIRAGSRTAAVVTARRAVPSAVAAASVSAPLAAVAARRAPVFVNSHAALVQALNRHSQKALTRNGARWCGVSYAQCLEAGCALALMLFCLAHFAFLCSLSSSCASNSVVCRGPAEDQSAGRHRRDGR
jgi:hypothetical protein